MVRYAMAIDVERCIGCEACMVACKAENEVPVGYYRLKMREIVTGKFPNLQGEFRLEQCFHCENAPCVGVCPTGATYKTAEGIVALDHEKCIGCKACVTACPYNMRFINPDGGFVDKCTFCQHRVAKGQEPACVETCPSGARTFGDLDNAQSPVSQAIAKAAKKDVLKPETEAKPKLFYLNSKFINTKLAETSPTVLSVQPGKEGR